MGAGQAHSVRMALLPCRCADGGWLVVQAHSVRMALLPCAGRGPGRRGGPVAGGWLVVQAHSVRMAFLPCAGADGGWVLVRPIRCAWRSFLVLVLMADGCWSGPFGAHGVPSLCWC